ncbi:MAG TPA: geranylgeranyl reductase family protein [Burkholderiaceae bacterium]|nr:geranylgeranyl reductase family protein [Burkholderiaceae bacterium]
MSFLETDVLVIGAGPAGSAAARTAAQLGSRVVLVDRHRFPRDKVCGDALIPDALEALARLGLNARVLAEARPLGSLRIYAPNGRCVELYAQMGCLPRSRLDELMREGAEQAGATFLAPCALAQALDRDGVIAGATFEPAAGGAPITVRARLTLLATGAAAGPLLKFGVCERRPASAIAARVYVRAPQRFAVEHDHLCISYDRHVCPGYGWLFPGPDGVFNVGVGYFDDTKARPPTTNIRRLFDRFVQTFAPARALLAVATPLTDLRGAPLRTALAGAHLSRPGLLVIGEAAGTTYSFSGEGIGKAIASGIVAGEIAARAPRDTQAAIDAARTYAACIRSDFAERFRAYKIAQGWLAYPAVLGFLARRAAAGGYVRQQLQALLTETGDPSELFSVAGLLKSCLR